MRRLWVLATFSLICLMVGISQAELSGSLDEKQIAERLKPVGQVNIETTPQSSLMGQTAAPTPLLSVDIGQKRYEETCKMCHATGLANAPKFGSKEDWGPRIAQGLDLLVQHAIHGYKAMPQKGGCLDCSDDEIKKAVEYMISNAK